MRDDVVFFVIVLLCTGLSFFLLLKIQISTLYFLRAQLAVSPAILETTDFSKTRRT